MEKRIIRNTHIKIGCENRQQYLIILRASSVTKQYRALLFKLYIFPGLFNYVASFRCVWHDTTHNMHR